MAKMRPPFLPEKLAPVISDGDLHGFFKEPSGESFEERRDKSLLAPFIDTGVRLAEMPGPRHRLFNPRWNLRSRQLGLAAWSLP